MPTHAQRMYELHGRLTTWWYGSFVEGSELKGVWEDAWRRFDQRLRCVLDANPESEEKVFDTEPDLLLQCFEAALADHDNILAAFPHELPEGWHEWLPFPPDD